MRILIWKHHINCIHEKVKKNIGVLSEMSKTAILFFCPFVRKIILWETLKDQLKTFNIYNRQKHASRLIIYKDKFTQPLMKKLNAPNVYKLNIYQIRSTIYV